MTDKAIITRFAPSPTGNLHIGSVRTALFAYLFSRRNRGKFLLRIEDTDKERSKAEYTKAIIEGLKWLGLNWDNETIVKQSERGSIYRKYLEQLIASGAAYISKEEPKEEGQRSEVVRLKNNGKEVVFSDIIRGEVVFNTAELGDIVIAKSIDEPIFHLANVVDDHEMGISHVIRGEDHISNTPRQILIREALGFPHPVYAHIPLVLAADRSKLSKRHGATSLQEFVEQKYLPEALLNYLALLGWHPESDDEIFSKDELIQRFDLGRVQKGGAVWNTEKLDWVNKQHLLNVGAKHRAHNYKAELLSLNADPDVLTDEMMARLEPVITERISKVSDIRAMFEKGELQLFWSEPNWKREAFLWKGQGEVKDVVVRLVKARELLESVEHFSKGGIKAAIWPYAEETGRGYVLWPLRYALSGLEKSPDPFTIAEILAKEKTLERLDRAISFLRNETN
ncbi:MAG: glutamate--tRNA ligase [Candidatus Taylorbacteria bacterium]|nr:glutamate--tRNA ligase [Candidatus Taylorbacteria bacterium]